MKIGSVPDESADYWEERGRIDEWTTDMEKVKSDIVKSYQHFTRKKADIEKIKKEAAKNKNPENLN
jgi:hypothetical protein